MSRIQLALNVDDLDTAVRFYSTLFDAEPAKRKPGYANFAIAEPPLKLVLIENAGQGGSLNHLGVEVETSEQVHGEIARLSDAGLFTEEQIATTCCFATQDKVWVTGPDAERWEVYTVLADSETFGTAPELGLTDAEAGDVCCGTAAEAEAEGACCGTDAKTKAVASGASCCT
ncbi:ArsI/CadI family heavy metal resistance metalloenzyme [Nocardia fluminea]|uniref:Cadmium-induced protein CadI n=1 Tax=Nocardia fluminea TaxID=134984 RepID=A0A2N3WX95_9NOCA|nr:ArsI/CadI family heavy metal resistance metalloenzyme [Nocardia fluminea]PKV98475.1 catechol 2,3-dioxygenase-like lactoylglutathione lyase family enzyme [Nocardia fluminea]